MRLSSVGSTKPDSALYTATGALFGRMEEKAVKVSLNTAIGELTEKLVPNAHLVFPVNAHAIMGLAGTCNTITWVEIRKNEANQFISDVRRTFILSSLAGRVAFLQDLFRYMTYVVTITGPQSSFHLIPGVRRETNNNHHITWTRDGIFKEFG